MHAGELPGEPGLQGDPGGVEGLSGPARSAGVHFHHRDGVSARDTTVSLAGAACTHNHHPLLPHSWLVKKRRNPKALSVLAKIRCSTEEEVKEEFDEIVLSTKSVGDQGDFRHSVKVLLQWKVFQR